jgi:hypothetical protein
LPYYRLIFNEFNVALTGSTIMPSGCWVLK